MSLLSAVPVDRASLDPGGLSGALRQLEARVHANSVAQLVPEHALLAVVGQLQQVEASG